MVYINNKMNISKKDKYYNDIMDLVDLFIKYDIEEITIKEELENFYNHICENYCECPDCGEIPCDCDSKDEEVNIQLHYSNYVDEEDNIEELSLEEAFKKARKDRNWIPEDTDEEEDSDDEDEDMPEPSDEEVKELVKEKDVFIHS